MNEKSLYKLSCGLYIISSSYEDKISGCVANTLQQVTSSPIQLSITLNKENYTEQLIEKSGKFNAVVVSQNIDMDVIRRFGFQSADNGGYAVFAGLEEIIGYIQNLHFEDEDIAYLRSLHKFSDAFLDYLRHFIFTGDIYAIKEGTPVFPYEPLIRVRAKIIEAQLLETAMLLCVNHQTLIATKARRIVKAAKGRAIMEFGARRAHNFDAANYGARAAYIGGVAGTATTYAADIIRLFVTLDEVWDYRTNEYHWNYLIGENRYVGDNKHYEYDWPLTEVSPFQVHEEDYLRSHAAHAKTVMLNIRRYEREVIEGIITLETYEKVFEKVVEYYKEHIANIVYIECCNEVEIPRFGGLRMEEYYPLYQCASRAIARLNAKHSYEQPLQIGGFGMSAGMSNWKYWDAFMRLLAKDEKRKIDYYSMHEYHGNPCRILEFYIRHEELRKEFNLPRMILYAYIKIIGRILNSLD